MSFNPNIPQPTDLLSNSQVDLLANNVALNSIFSRNHTAFSIATDSGKHKFIEMVNQSGIPAPAPPLSSGTGTMWTQNAGGSQLFYSNANSGNIYQLTRVNNTEYTNFGLDPAGWTFLPGGLVLAYGSKNSPGSSGTISYNYTFTSVVAVQLTPRNDGSHSAFNYWVDGAPGLTSLSYQGSTSGSQRLYYFVLGF